MFQHQNKKKILIVIPDLPYPLTKGGRQGVFHFIDKLRDRYQISILFPQKKEEIGSYKQLMLIWTNVAFYPFKGELSISYKQSIFNKIKIVIKRLLHYNQKNRDSDFIKRNSALYSSTDTLLTSSFVNYVSKVVTENIFDIVQVEFYKYISLAHILPFHIEKIFIHHEIRYVINEIEMSYFKSVSCYDQYIYHIAKNVEIESLKLFDKVVTVSDVDKCKLQKEFSTLPIYSSPLMVNFVKEDFNYDYKFNNRLTFVGSDKHFPNIDGINWFLTEVWPLVHKKNKTLELHIIGKGWSPKIFQKEVQIFKNVFFDGYIENLKDILPNSIAIIPIRIGSGMRMKILDAVNYKIPFITTSVGVEGLDFINQKDCLISDTAADFADSIITLIQNQELQQKFIDNSINTLHHLYNEETLINRRISIYES